MCRLTPTALTCLIACGIVTVSQSLPAQSQPGKATVTSPPAAASEQRPAPEALRVPAVDPKLEAVLAEWHAKTGNIKKLQGQHRRWTFEPVFMVAKVSSGKFYYEAPDRGRIDLTSDNMVDLAKQDIDPKTPGVQIPQPGAGGVFTIKPDKGERWICDGKQIVRIDDSEKIYEVVPIPAANRGANIMDGPLPFLFGLPPDKAKQRYAMTLHPSPQPNTIYLEVHPLRRDDAALWQKADVLLDGETYLPVAVKLLDNKGQGTTIYSFNEHKADSVNLLAIFGAGDPFKPNLFGYKQVQNPGPPADGAFIQQTGAIAPPAKVATATTAMPSVIGMDHKEAATLLKRRGLANIAFSQGPVTSNPALRWHVVEQNPPAGDSIPDAGQAVLKLHVFEEDVRKFEADQRKKNAQQPQ